MVIKVAWGRDETEAAGRETQQEGDERYRLGAERLVSLEAR